MSHKLFCGTPKILRATAVILVYVSFFHLPCWAVPENADSGPQVTSLEGNAQVRFSGSEEWVSLETDTPLEAGDRLRVSDGSRVELLTQDGDVLEVEEGSDMEVEETAPKSFSLRLFLGGLLAKVLPEPDKKFRVQTPVAVAAVRGTEFGVDVDKPGSCELGVTEGTVSFQGLNKTGETEGEEIQVSSQRGAQIRRGARPRVFAHLPPRAKRRLVRMALLRGRAPQLKNRWQHLPPERRLEIRRRLAERWRDLPPEQKARVRQQMRRRWRDMPPEKREEIRRRRGARPRRRPAERAR